MRKALGAYTAAVIALLYAPIVVMVAFSFNAGKDRRWSGFTLDWYGRVLESRELREALWNTVIIGTASTILATVLGTLAALAARRAFRGRRFYTALVCLPILAPDIVLGIGLLSLYHALGIRLSLATAAVAHTTFNLAYVAVIVSARLQGTDPSLELAARDLGATPLGAFLKVTLPAILPGILAGAIIAFTLSFDDFVITYFTTGPGDTTLPVKVYALLARFTVSPEINAVSALILAASLVLILAALRIAGPRIAGGGR